jgi:hypothetical protein
MLESWVLLLVCSNVLAISSLIIASIFMKPYWLVYSKYQILVDCQYIVYISIIFSAGALYEAQDLAAPKICMG